MPDWDGDHPVTSLDAADPHVTLLQRFPVKSLDPERPTTARLVAAGALAGDRRWAIVDRPSDASFEPASAGVGGSGAYINGKKTGRVHRLRSSFVPRTSGGPAVDIRRQGAPATTSRRFRLATGDDDRRAVHRPLDDWLSSFFDRSVSVRRTDTGFQDDRTHHGPTLVSSATLREVAAWIDVDLESARRRFRANVEIGGVPPFWEDRCFGDSGEAVPVHLGEATILGISPCPRCVVPGRNPDTGTETPNFRERFVDRRRATRPAWTASDRYDHDFQLMVNTRVPAAATGTTIAVGDAVERRRPRPV